MPLARQTLPVVKVVQAIAYRQFQVTDAIACVECQYTQQDSNRIPI